MYVSVTILENVFKLFIVFLVFETLNLLCRKNKSTNLKYRIKLIKVITETFKTAIKTKNLGKIFLIFTKLCLMEKFYLLQLVVKLFSNNKIS